MLSRDLYMTDRAERPPEISGDAARSRADCGAREPKLLSAKRRWSQAEAKAPSKSFGGAPVKSVPAMLTAVAIVEQPTVAVRLPDGIAVELHNAEHARPDDVGQRVACLRRGDSGSCCAVPASCTLRCDPVTPYRVFAVQQSWSRAVPRFAPLLHTHNTVELPALRWCPSG